MPNTLPDSLPFTPESVEMAMASVSTAILSRSRSTDHVNEQISVHQLNGYPPLINAVGECMAQSPSACKMANSLTLTLATAGPLAIEPVIALAIQLAFVAGFYAAQQTTSADEEIAILKRMMGEGPIQ